MASIARVKRTRHRWKVRAATCDHDVTERALEEQVEQEAADRATRRKAPLHDARLMRSVCREALGDRDAHEWSSSRCGRVMTTRPGALVK
jgi:hypothetical protein